MLLRAESHTTQAILQAQSTMALPLPITPTDIGALTPNTRSEAEAAFTVRSQAPSQPISIPEFA